MKFITGSAPAVTVVVLLLLTEINAALRSEGTFIIDVNANWRFGCNKGIGIILEPEDLIVQGTLYFKNNDHIENAFNAAFKNFMIYQRTNKNNYYNLINCGKFKKLKKAIEEPFLIVYEDSGIISGLKFSKYDTGFTKSLKYTIASEIQFDLGKLVQKNEPYSTFSTEEKSPLGSCVVEYDARTKLDLPDEKVGYDIRKTLYNCTQENDNNITPPDFCNDPSKMNAGSTHESNFNVIFKDETGLLKHVNHYIAASSIPFKDMSKNFDSFMKLDLKLKGLVQGDNPFPEFKESDTELVTSLQVTKLNKSILKGKTGKTKKLQKVHQALSCLTWLPTTFHRDLVELVLQCN